jgi:hypothetical protein
MGTKGIRRFKLLGWIVEIFKPDWTKWKRVDLESQGEPSDPSGKRKLAEEETNKDLRKPIQQLICDVHEEALHPNRRIEENLLHANKRMVSMMGRVALAQERSNKLLIWLTVVLIGLTVVLIGLTVVLVILTAVLIYLTVKMGITNPSVPTRQPQTTGYALYHFWLYG